MGPWNQMTLRGLFNKFTEFVKMPSSYEKIRIFADGNDDYTTVLQEYYSISNLEYGQKIKSQNGKKLIIPLKKVIFGEFDKSLIDTNVNESVNSVLRGRLAKLVRKTQTYAKNKYSLLASLAVFRFYWNFIHLRPKKDTPAIQEKLTTKTWTWGMFLHKQLSYI
jgi:hypothetical protein